MQLVICSFKQVIIYTINQTVIVMRENTLKRPENSDFSESAVMKLK